MTNEMLEKVKVLLESDDFGKEIENVDTIEELAKAFETHGVEITLQELKEICMGVVSKNNSDTLDESQLDDVAGGCVLSGLMIYGATILVSAMGGYVLGRVMRG